MVIRWLLTSQVKSSPPQVFMLPRYNTRLRFFLLFHLFHGQSGRKLQVIESLLNKQQDFRYHSLLWHKWCKTSYESSFLQLRLFKSIILATVKLILASTTIKCEKDRILSFLLSERTKKKLYDVADGQRWHIQNIKAANSSSLVMDAKRLQANRL